MKFFEKKIDEPVLEKIITINQLEEGANGLFLLKSNTACMDQLAANLNNTVKVDLNLNLLKENCEFGEIKKIGNSIFDYYKSKIYWCYRDVFDWLNF